MGFVLTEYADRFVVHGGIEEASPAYRVRDLLSLLIRTVDALLDTVFRQEGISITQDACGIGEEGRVGLLVEILKLAGLELLYDGFRQCHFVGLMRAKITKKDVFLNFF